MKVIKGRTNEFLIVQPSSTVINNCIIKEYHVPLCSIDIEGLCYGPLEN